LAYPTFKDLKYPKPGYPNPVADLYIHPLGGEAWKVTYEEPLDKRDLLDDLFGFVERGAGDETDGWGDKKLITNVEWMGNDMVMVSETNRVSDHFRGVLVDVKAQTGVVVRDEKIDEGWFEIVLSHDEAADYSLMI
jgi:dipeptidyl aminopeptidase B